MSKKQSFLWERILEVVEATNNSEDALEKWEKQMLLKVLLRQLKEDMKEKDFVHLIVQNKNRLNPA
jgi:hypothetical protein